MVEKKRFEIDRVLALLGLVISAIVIAVLYLVVGSVTHTLLFIYVFSACLLYLLIGPNLKKMKRISFYRNMGERGLLIINSVYFIIFSISILSMKFREHPYERPLFFFISIALLTGVLTFDLLMAPDNELYKYILLTKVIMIGIYVRYSLLLLFPGHSWFDPWFHERFIEEMIRTSRIPGDFIYSNLPGMHLFFGAIMEVTGMSFRAVFLVVLVPLQVVILNLVTYLMVTKYIGSYRTALLSALLINIADMVLARSLLPYPNNFAWSFAYALIFFTFVARSAPTLSDSSIVIITMGVLIISHTITSLAFVLILISSWLWLAFYRWQFNNHVKRSPLSGIGISCLLFVVAMLAWWIYASGHDIILAKVIKWAFDVDVFLGKPPDAAVSQNANIPPMEIILDRVGFSVFLFLSILGALFYISKNSPSRVYGSIVAISGSILVSIAFFGAVLKVFVVATRWYFMAQVLLAVPAAQGVNILFSQFGKMRILASSFFVCTLTFFMIGSSPVNPDRQLFTRKGYRSLLIESELTSMKTISEKWDRNFASDFHAYAYLIYLNGYDKVKLINQQLADRDFSARTNDAIVIRNYIITDSLYLNGLIWKLEYDPVSVLTNQEFWRVFDSGTVFLYYPESMER